MSQDFRLDNIGMVNRNKKISFTFNGKKYFGYEGDTCLLYTSPSPRDQA